jgi:hypothetical protein
MIAITPTTMPMTISTAGESLARHRDGWRIDPVMTERDAPGGETSTLVTFRGSAVL